MSGDIDEARRRQFESGWATGNPTPIENFLPAPENTQYLATLEELVHVELEFGWRRSDVPGTRPPRVEHYLERFPRLDRPGALLRLLRQEFRVRHRFGDRPPVEEFARRFPALVVEGTELGPPPEPDDPGVFVSGKHLGRYQLIEEHARGGFGAVWRAKDEKLGREIALKRLTGRLAALPDFRGRFIGEARTTACLEHPGIVPIYDLSEAGEDHAFYAMKLVHGATLADAIERMHGQADGASERAVEERRLLNAFLMVCQTMEYAHARGVIHRDLKPQNIILGDYGETVILDWGLAKGTGGGEETPAAVATGEEPAEADGDSGTTRHGTVQGTPAYMSPEQAAGRVSEVGTRSDIYSLGVILYQLLTGRVPFHGGDGEEILRQVIEGRPMRPKIVNAGVHPALEAVCLKSMAVGIVDRYPSVTDLTADLQRFLADEPVAAFAEPWRLRAGRWVRRHRALVTGLVAAAFVALVGLVVVAVILAASNRREQAAKDRAVANFDLAREAVDRYCIKVSEHPRLRGAGFEDLRKELYQAAAGFYEKFVRLSEHDPAVRQTRAKSFINLALIVRDTESPEKALTFYRQAIDILRDLADQDPPRRVPLLMLAAAHNDCGTMFVELGRRDPAAAHLEKARALYAQVDRLFPDDPTPRRFRAPLLLNLSTLCSDRGDLAGAERLILEAIDNLKAIVDLPPEPDELPGAARWQLAKCHHNLALLYVPEKLSRPAAREAADREAMRLCRRLTEAFPLEPNYQVQLATTQRELGMHLEHQGRFEEAGPCFAAGLATSRKLVRAHPGVPAYLDLLAYACTSLAPLLAAGGEPDRAHALYREALELREELEKKQPAVWVHASEIAGIYTNLGCMYSAAGDPARAGEAFDRSAKGYDSLARRFPDEVEHTEEAGIAYFQAGQAASLRSDRERALERFNAAVPLLERACELGSTYAEVPVALRRVRAFRVWLLSEAGRFEDTVPDWKRLRDLGASGAYAKHLELAARKTARAAGGNTDQTGFAALGFALAAGAAEADGPRAAGYAATAVRLLEAARVAGHFEDAAKVEILETCVGFAPLRGRDDFRALIERIREK